MKITRLICALLLLAAAAGAKGEVKWLEKEYNFGVIREADGKVTGEVSFVNNGSDATYINRVRPSCGCTGASYPHGMIEPGDTATISFTYNPQGRPGPFDKTVKVYMGAANDMTVIRIRGTVMGASATLDSQFPKECGSLRLENTLLTAGEMTRGKSRHFFINVYNQGDKTLKPTFGKTPKGLDADIKPRTLAPGETATVTLHLKTSDIAGNGPFELPVELFSDGKDSPKVTLELTGVVVPDTRDIPLETLREAPQAFILPEFVELGENVDGESVSFQFEVANEGKTALNVERVYSREAELELNDLPGEIDGGEKGVVKGTLNLSKLPAGAFRVKVDVLTNDPIHPVRTCGIVGIKKK